MTLIPIVCYGLGMTFRVRLASKMRADKATYQNPQLPEGFKRLGGAVKPADAGQRFDAYLAAVFPFFSRSLWQKRIVEAKVLLNGARVRTSERLAAGDCILMYQPEEAEPVVDTNVSALFQEDGVLCAFKPAGLPMHEGGPFRKNTFARVVSERFGAEWSAVHRLDKETSGIVLCGASEDIRRKLTYQLRDGHIRKEYQAIVQGTPKDNAWFIDAPIGNLEESMIRIKNWVVEDGTGLHALTEFLVEERTDGYALIRAFPRTGRTNQIRIHAAYSGHPLVGDKLFHPDETVFLDYWDNGMSERIAVKTGHWRCCLHARALSFEHPLTGVFHRIESPLADDFSAVWARLKLGIEYASALAEQPTVKVESFQ